MRTRNANEFCKQELRTRFVNAICIKKQGKGRISWRLELPQAVGLLSEQWKGESGPKPLRRATLFSQMVPRARITTPKKVSLQGPRRSTRSPQESLTWVTSNDPYEPKGSRIRPPWGRESKSSNTWCTLQIPLWHHHPNHGVRERKKSTSQIPLLLLIPSPIHLPNCQVRSGQPSS